MVETAQCRFVYISILCNRRCFQGQVVFSIRKSLLQPPGRCTVARAAQSPHPASCPIRFNSLQWSTVSLLAAVAGAAVDAICGGIRGWF